MASTTSVGMSEALSPTRYLRTEVEVAFIHEHGDDLYGFHNWRKGQPLSELLNSGNRHISAAINGEDFDPKSGKYHLAHAAWNILVALHQMIHSEHYAELDDRVDEFGDWVNPVFAATERARELESGSDVTPKEEK